MPTPYESIVDKPGTVTKTSLCGLLNLDVSRPNLKFSPTEIKTAYKQRALRFHPDKQSQFEQPIPTAICTVLMSDITLARDRMLNETDNIYGATFLKPHEWVATAIRELNAIKAGTSWLPSSVPWLSRCSNDYLTIILLSTYSDGQLNFRYINQFAEQLAAIRRLLEIIDGSILIDFLRQVKETLNNTDELNAANILQLLKDTLPTSMLEDKGFDSLLLVLQNTSKELKDMLTDDFIEHLQKIICFLPQVIATIPSWKHIIGVYFTSLIFTANSLPKFFNATKVITEVTRAQKRGPALALAIVPSLLLTPLILPANMTVQLGIQLTWILLKALLQQAITASKLLISGANLLRSLTPNSDKSLTHETWSLFASAFNFTVRFSLNILIETLGVVPFMLTDKSPLSPLLSNINTTFDTLLQQPKEHAVVINAEPRPTANIEEPTQSPGFFAKPTSHLHNRADLWLQTFLANLPAAMPTQQDEAHHFLPTMN
ncbi:MAG: hypothetical protein ACHP65_02940 [Legionellales bacterium]